MAALTDGSVQVRKMAASALGEIGPDARQAIPALIQALGDVDEGVRRRVALSLGEMGAEARSAAPALILTLRDGSSSVRRWAAAALGEIGPTAPAAIPALIAALAQDDMRDRAVVVAALVKMGGRAVPRLVEALRHADPRIRCLAARALAKGGPPPEAVAPLQALLNDPDPGVRESAAEALRGPSRRSGRADARTQLPFLAGFAGMGPPRRCSAGTARFRAPRSRTAFSTDVT